MVRLGSTGNALGVSMVGADIEVPELDAEALGVAVVGAATLSLERTKRAEKLVSSGFASETISMVY